MTLTPLPADIPPLKGVKDLLINLLDELPADLSHNVPFTIDDAEDAAYQLEQHLYYIHRELARYRKETRHA